MHRFSFKNPDYETPDFSIDNIDWDFITKDIKTERVLNGNVNTGRFDRLVYTDTHVGMNPNPSGYSLYGGKWDEHELEDRLGQMVNYVLINQKSRKLIVDDLGDLIDGWDGKTVRREHDLPQNMDNQKAFDVALRFKYQMFLRLKDYYNEILFNNITEDNHSGSAGYVVNSAFKSMVDASNFKGIEVVNHRKFISHYQVGGQCVYHNTWEGQ